MHRSPALLIISACGTRSSSHSLHACALALQPRVKMAGRRRRGGHLVNSSPEDDASESEPITVKIGLDEVRKLKELQHGVRHH